MRKTLKLIPKHSRLLNENCCCNSEQRCWLETYKATFLIVPYDYSRMLLYILSRGIIKSREGKKESNIVRKRKLWVQVDYVASLCITWLFLYYLLSSLVLAFREIKGEKKNKLLYKTKKVANEKWRIKHAKVTYMNRFTSHNIKGSFKS